MTTTAKAMNISELESSTREQLMEVANEVGLEGADSLRKRDRRRSRRRRDSSPRPGDP